MQSFSADLQVEWGQIGVPERETDLFGFTVLAQAANIDWGALEYWHPYGTVPAEGSNFIGRGEVVKNLASRLLHSPMEPFYITGQQRVGKTSLALAAVTFASENAAGRKLHGVNILSGYFANADAKQALAELGRRIEEYITNNLPRQAHKPHYSFDGTLSPIVRLSESARNIAPDEQFIIIIDEFDEIHSGSIFAW
jgi:AAA+ ATPase superfamily predicted ATPase